MASVASPSSLNLEREIAAPALRTGRRALLAFALLGIILATPNLAFLAWSTAAETEYAALGNYFLTMNIGLLAGLRLSQYINQHYSLRSVFVSGCLLATLSLTGLTVLSTSDLHPWRLVAFAFLGISASFLQTGIAASLARLYAHSASAVLTLALTLLGLGICLTDLLGAILLNVTRPLSILAGPAVLPALWLVPYVQRLTRSSPPEPPTHSTPSSLRYPAAVLLSLLLFVQFANEWVLINWLPLFMSRQVGQSPARALLMVALFAAALTIARLAGFNRIKRRGTKRLVLYSLIATFFGSVFLATTNNVLGSLIGVSLVALGAGLVLPVAVRYLQSRQPVFDPSSYSGLFTLALTGALLGSWAVGHLAELNSLRILMLLPLFGNWVAAILLGLLRLESKLASALR